MLLMMSVMTISIMTIIMIMIKMMIYILDIQETEPMAQEASSPVDTSWADGF